MTAAKEERLLRVKQIVPHMIPVSRSTWWLGVAQGTYPRGLKLSERVTVWRLSDIQKLMNSLGH